MKKYNAYDMMRRINGYLHKKNPGPEQVQYLKQLSKEIDSPLTMRRLDSICEKLTREIAKKALDKAYRRQLIVIKDYFIVRKAQVANYNVFQEPLYKNGFDNLYHKTETDYRGTIMLPIIQQIDFRKGASEGECYGFFFKWMQDVLNNRKPYEINPYLPPPYKPIRFSTSLAQKYPELNHRAPITGEIVHYQQSQGLFGDTSAILKKLAINIRYVQKRTYINNAETIAANLSRHAQENPGSVCELSLIEWSGAHAVGYAELKDGSCHYFDANYFWVKFQNADDFIKWFPFFYKTSSYRLAWSEYAIQAYHHQFATKCFFNQKYNYVHMMKMSYRYIYCWLKHTLRSEHTEEKQSVVEDKVSLRIQDDFSIGKKPMSPTLFHHPLAGILEEARVCGMRRRNN
jgi:hypothetical protein